MLFLLYDNRTPCHFPQPVLKKCTLDDNVYSLYFPKYLLSFIQCLIMYRLITIKQFIIEINDYQI